MENTTQSYSTTDTTLAAYLISQGLELLDLDYTESESVAFLFDSSNKELADLLRKFQMGTAEANVIALFKIYKQLISKVQRNNRNKRY